MPLYNPTGASRLISRITPAGTPASTVETDLQTYTLPGNKLAVDGQTLRIVACGTLTATTRSRTVRLYFGASNFLGAATVSSSDVVWRMVAEVVRTGATAQICTGFLEISNANADVAGHAVGAETLSGDVVIKMTGQSAGAAAADDIRCTFMSVQFLL